MPGKAGPRADTMAREAAIALGAGETWARVYAGAYRSLGSARALRYADAVAGEDSGPFGHGSGSGAVADAADAIARVVRALGVLGRP